MVKAHFFGGKCLFLNRKLFGWITREIQVLIGKKTFLGEIGQKSCHGCDKSEHILLNKELHYIFMGLRYLQNKMEFPKRCVCVRDERISFSGPNTNTNIFVQEIFIRI